MKKSEALHILDLSNGASDEQVKAAHRKKVIENHPDKFAQDSGEYQVAEEKTKRINEARDVLLSRKWEPEYVRRGPYANPYGNPYSNPYQQGAPSGYPRSPQDQQSAGSPTGNPFEGFGDGWFTWNWQGGTGTATEEGQPFNPFNPFSYTVPQKTPEEKKAEAKTELKREAIVLAAKLVCVAAFSLTGSFPLGLFFYVAITAAYALWKRMRGCLAPFLVPIILVLTPIMSILALRAAFLVAVLIALCLFCVISDVKTLNRLIRKYRNL
ncbi:MAG: DnaJ domain-containing protein [Eggerthellaceae bacterium]|jgi:hypothetical protein|nr:DnaJ domain-containing protein [Eggerthellaceae bacterium]